ncbi:hypothetical protein F5B21DRAFT_86783 [Xylaria acuta]|nr:hypothetical protein F5B21DRAFT_86783 [Xylaria acuta]
MTPLSVEAIVAIIGVIVGLPPAVLVLVRYIERHRGARRGTVFGTISDCSHSPNPSIVQVRFYLIQQPNFAHHLIHIGTTLTLSMGSPTVTPATASSKSSTHYSRLLHSDVRAHIIILPK